MPKFEYKCPNCGDKNKVISATGDSKLLLFLSLVLIAIGVFLIITTAIIEIIIGVFFVFCGLLLYQKRSKKYLCKNCKNEVQL